MALNMISPLFEAMHTCSHDSNDNTAVCLAIGIHVESIETIIIIIREV